jgi:hypothetical protein
MSFLEASSVEIPDTAYNDLGDGDEGGLPSGAGVDDLTSNETSDADEEDL